MKGRNQRRFIRDFEGGHFLDLFLVSAITSLLTIRFYLEVTGYPRLGAGNIHIAHVLWGGLLMLSAIVILLSFLGRGSHQVGAVLGGLGFGAFIDEIGKFITLDNDYFYEPAAAMIYVVFILTYLAIRSIHREKLASPPEYLGNAIQQLKLMATGTLSVEERDLLLRYLDQADPAHPMVKPIREIVGGASPVPAAGPGLWVQARDALQAFYRRIARLPGFPTAIITFFTALLAIRLIHAVLIIFYDLGPGDALAIGLLAPVRRLEDASPADWGQMASSMLAAVFVALGVFQMRRSRLAALRMFQRSVLVSIYLTQVFVFYREQWAALLGLLFNILVFAALHFMIERERARSWKGI